MVDHICNCKPPFCLGWTRCVRSEALLELWGKMELECWKTFLPGCLSDEWVASHDSLTVLQATFVSCEPRDISLTVFHWPCSFFVSRPIWTLGLGMRRKNCEYTLSPHPFLNPLEPNHRARKLYGMQTHLKPGLATFYWQVNTALVHPRPGGYPLLPQVISSVQFLARLKAAFI